MIATETKIVDFKIVVFEEVNNSGFCLVGGNALNMISSAKLAITTTAHQKQVTLCRKQTCVSTSAANLFHSAVKLNLFWSVQTIFIAMAELPIDTVTPSVNLTIRIEIG